MEEEEEEEEFIRIQRILYIEGPRAPAVKLTARLEEEEEFIRIQRIL